MKLNTNNLKKRTEGFTIIEVLIVLAIAGLILLVVFLAVPALQRNQRNNGRQSEASRLSTAVGNFIGNNQGTLPGLEGGSFDSAAGGNAFKDGNAIIADFGSFKYFTGTNFVSSPPLVVPAAAGATAKMVANQITVTDKATTAAAVTADGIVIDDEAVCGPPSSAGVVTTVGTARQVAVIYTTESSGGNYNQVCIQAE